MTKAGRHVSRGRNIDERSIQLGLYRRWDAGKERGEGNYRLRAGDSARPGCRRIFCVVNPDLAHGAVLFLRIVITFYSDGFCLAGNTSFLRRQYGSKWRPDW